MAKTIAIMFDAFRGKDREVFESEVGRWKGEPMDADPLYTGPNFIPDKESQDMLDLSDVKRWLCVRSGNIRDVHGLKFEEVRLISTIRPTEVPLSKEARKLARKVGWGR